MTDSKCGANNVTMCSQYSTVCSLLTTTSGHKDQCIDSPGYKDSPLVYVVVQIKFQRKKTGIREISKNVE